MLRGFIFISILAQAFALYSSDSAVVQLTPNNFDKRILNREEVWLVEFYAPWCGHCRRLKPEYEKAANVLKGIIKVGAVNADEHKDLTKRFQVSGYPTIKIFGHDKNHPEDFNGERTAKSIAEAGLAAARQKVLSNLGEKPESKSGSKGRAKAEGEVINLTDSNFDEMVLQSDDAWLVEFFAPWCGHCKNLAPQYEDAAKQLKGKVKLGAIDATVHVQQASKYNVNGFPTIKYFPPGKKSPSKVEEYDGSRSAKAIVDWAQEKLQQLVPAPEPKEITNEQLFTETCGESLLCVIAVLPPLLDCQASCRNDYLKIVKGMAEKYKDKGWGWMWTETGAQPDFEATLDLGGFGYPVLTVLNVKKMKYVMMKGSFSKEGIAEFLRDISYGKGSSLLIKGATLPKIMQVEPWDGKDVEVSFEAEPEAEDAADRPEKEEL